MTNWDLIAEQLSARFGIGLTGSPIDNNRGLLRVEGIDAPNGFGIEIVIGWRSIEAIFRPDTFAAALLRTLREGFASQVQEFMNLADLFSSKGIKSYLQDKLISNNNSWQSTSLSDFSLKCTALTDHSDDDKVVIETGNACTALILSLLPVERIDEPLSHGENEGMHSRVEVNQYERSPSNRAAAIAYHGSFCQACGFDFGKVYGSFGQGYIEVHHLTPVSQMGQAYAVNPVTDLLPLCANCHSMVHRINPPLTLEQLRKLLSESQ